MALLSVSTLASAAERIGVNELTLRRWLKVIHILLDARQGVKSWRSRLSNFWTQVRQDRHSNTPASQSVSMASASVHPLPSLIRSTKRLEMMDFQGAPGCSRGIR
jgi:hypothetical protein